MMFCVLTFELTIRDSKVSTSFHLSLHRYIRMLYISFELTVLYPGGV
jgi:hypothetical protein